MTKGIVTNHVLFALNCGKSFLATNYTNYHELFFNPEKFKITGLQNRVAEPGAKYTEVVNSCTGNVNKINPFLYALFLGLSAF